MEASQQHQGLDTDAELSPEEYAEATGLNGQETASSRGDEAAPAVPDAPVGDPVASDDVATHDDGGFAEGD